jgi:hypothetical protein
MVEPEHGAFPYPVEPGGGRGHGAGDAGQPGPGLRDPADQRAADNDVEPPGRDVDAFRLGGCAVPQARSGAGAVGGDPFACEKNSAPSNAMLSVPVNAPRRGRMSRCAPVRILIWRSAVTGAVPRYPPAATVT